MFARVQFGATALASVIAVYLVYAVIVVPLVEPSAKFRKSKPAASRPAARPRKLDHLFADGSWELDRPKVIETDQGTLLFDEYEPMEDGHLKLTPCTVICYTDQGKKNAEQSPPDSSRRAIVLRAVQGATLNFDRPLNLLKGEVGNLIGGQLDGEITITSPPSELGRDDAIALVTRNVQLDARRIWTPHEVRFRYGPNVGVGRDLAIYLGGSKPQGKSGKPSIGLGGVKLLELLHLDRLDLQLNDSGLFGGVGGKQAGNGTREGTAGQASSGTQRSADRVVQVTCKGPLKFDFDRQVISLEDHVDLVRHNVNAPSDQLLCQLLEIYFTNSVASTLKSDDPESNSERSNRLTPSKVVATGYPVIIRAASIGVGTRAERLEYDCILRRIWLKDRDKVLFQDRQRSIQARELMYTLETQGKLGDIVGVGPGVMHGIVGTKDQTLDINWQNRVVSRRIDNLPVITFTSHVTIAVQGAGTFSTDTLHLYLNEKPRHDDANKVRLEPDRLHAIGNVRVETPNLSAKLNEAKLWFRVPDGPLDPTSFATAASPSQFATPGLQHDESRSGPAPKHFVLNGQVVEALVVLEKRPIVDRLVLRGDFQLDDDTTNGQAFALQGSAAEQLTVKGNLLELQEGASERPRAALLGSPAEVASRGMSVRGDRFHVYPADNVLDIVGPGDATFPMKQLGKEKGPPTTSPGKIRWKKQMHFDGELASFEGSVAVNISRASDDGDFRGVAMGDVVTTRLTKRVAFRQPESQGSVSLEELTFEGWGFFEVEQIDLNGQRKSSQQIQVRQLTINQTTGEIRGEGPGWLRGIHRGRERIADSQLVQALPVSPSGLNFLRVDFAHTLSGNLHHRQLEFLQGTKTLYGPVDSWDDSLDKYEERDLPEKAIVLTCDRLGIAQMAADIDADQVEIEATGNAHVEGNSFSATGGRISYAHAKDQIVLEGDGRNAATLAFQKQPGSPPSNVSAKKIMYWPRTRQFEIDDLMPSNFFDVGQLRGLRAGESRPR